MMVGGEERGGKEKSGEMLKASKFSLMGVLISETGEFHSAHNTRIASIGRRYNILINVVCAGKR